MGLAAFEVVAQEQVEDLRHAVDVLGHDPDEAAGLGVHGGQPHHVRVVLTKALGAGDGDLRVLQAGQDLRLLLLGVGEPGLALGVDLVERGFGNIHKTLADQSGHQAVEHGEDQGADLVAVHVGVGADDDLAPAQGGEVERLQVLRVLVLHLHAAAQHLHQVRDDVGLEDAHVVGFQAVEDLAAHRHDALELGVAGELAGAQGRVALDDVDLAPLGVAAAAVDELLDPVCDVDGAGELLLHPKAGALGRLAAALVDEDLVCDELRLRLVLQEVDLQLLLEKLRHGQLDEAVVDRLLGLVLVGGLGREAVRHQDQAVLHVLEADRRLVLLVAVRGAEVGVDGRDEGAPDRLVRRAAVFQPRGVVIILQGAHPVREAEGAGDLHPVLVLVLAVAAPALGLDEMRPGQRILPRQLRHVVHDAVGIEEVLRLKAALGLLEAEAEGDAGVGHRLALQDVVEVLRRDVDVGEDLQVREPARHRAGLLPVRRALAQLLARLAHHAALFKAQVVAEAVAPHRHVHVAGGVLRRAGAQPVQAEGEAVVAAVVVVILAAGVELAVDKLPVPALLPAVPVQRAAAAEVLDLDAPVPVIGQDDQVAVALPRFVDGVGEDLEHRVLAAVQPVRAEDHARTKPDPVRALELRDAVIAVGGGRRRF